MATAYLNPGLPVDSIYGTPNVILPQDNITGTPPLNRSSSSKNSGGSSPTIVTNGPKQNITIVTGADEYGQLLETQWRGIGFPCSRFEQTTSFDLAIHKYPHLDVARVENMGRNSRVFILTIPFVNTIARSSNETWQPGNQFGTRSNWDLMRRNWDYDTSSGYLQHPEIGNVICKLQEYSFKYEEKPRNGVIVTAKFIECIDDSLTVQDTNGAKINSLTTQGYDIDNAIANLPKNANPPGLNLLQLFSNISGFINNVISYPGRLANSLNSQLQAYTSVVEGAAQDIYSAPNLIYDQGLAIFNQNKYQQLGVYNNFVTQTNNYSKLLNPPNNTTTSSATITTLTPTINIKYDINKLRMATTTYQHLMSTAQKASSSTTSTNSSTGKTTIQHQIISKTIVFVQSMIAYYNSLHHNSTAQATQSLYSYLSTLQSLSTNGSANVLSFVTKLPMSWIQIAKYTNNSLDQIMALNKINNTMIFAPKSSVVYYISVTGA